MVLKLIYWDRAFSYFYYHKCNISKDILTYSVHLSTIFGAAYHLVQFSAAITITLAEAEGDSGFIDSTIRLMENTIKCQSVILLLLYG